MTAISDDSNQRKKQSVMTAISDDSNQRRQQSAMTAIVWLLTRIQILYNRMVADKNTTTVVI
jgi:hypothetical protein